MKVGVINEKLASLLGEGVKLHALQAGMKNILPLQFRYRYQYYRVSCQRTEFVLAVEDATEELGHVSMYLKHAERLSSLLGDDVVFFMPPVPARVRFRYMRGGLAFISADGSANLPGLLRMTKLRVSSNVPERSYCSPLAQLIVLRQLLIGDMHGVTQKEISEKLGFSRMGVSVALKELKMFGLGEYLKVFSMNERGEALWKLALPYLRAPMKSMMNVAGPAAHELGLLAGESALSRLSLLDEPLLPVRAVAHAEFLSLRKTGQLTVCRDMEEADAVLQVWSYPPQLLLSPGGRCVDVLSLRLSFSDSENDRVLQELNRLAMPWK